MPRDAVSRAANVERTGGQKWVNVPNWKICRVTGDSRHHGGLIEFPPPPKDNPQALQHYGIEGFKGGPQSIGPQLLCLSDSPIKLFHSGYRE